VSDKAAFAVRVEDFLSPVAGDDPAGPPLRYEGTYDAVRAARRADDPGLPQGIWEHDLKRADWEGAAALCDAALRERSKDLQLCAWLLEAWLHLYGFAGAAAGLGVMHAVAERFWDGLHPRGGDGEDPCEARALVVEWMDGTVADALGQVPLTAPSLADPDAHPWSAREGALRLENQARRDSAAMEAAEREGAVTLARFDRAVSLTPAAFYAVAGASLRAAEEAAGRLQALLDERCGAAAPGLLRTRGVVSALRGWTDQVLAGRPGEATDSAPGEEPIAGESPSGAVPMPSADAAQVPASTVVLAGRGPASRDEAFRWLRAASDYLVQTEPHSPVPYLVRRAVLWGGLSLPELMIDFQRSGYDLGALYILLGFATGEE
jgi:type VI secretion system protein ImpA